MVRGGGGGEGGRIKLFLWDFSNRVLCYYLIVGEKARQFFLQTKIPLGDLSVIW